MADPTGPLPGNRTTTSDLRDIQNWCSGLPLHDYYHWKCCGTEAEITGKDYKKFYSECRKGVVNTEGALRSCTRLCGGTSARLFGFYAHTTPEQDAVGAAYYCECDIIVAGEKDAPPKAKLLNKLP